MLKKLFQKDAASFKTAKNNSVSLETCKKCSFHSGYEMGQIFCKYWNNLNSIATTKSSVGDIVILNCPKEK